MNIPFADIKKQYLSISDEINNSIQEVLNDTAFIRGKYVERFENNLSKLYGINHCIGVGNGTDAIYLALRVLKFKSILTKSNTICSEEDFCKHLEKELLL